MSQSNQFNIFYRSQATEGHAMDAETLGTSLISFAKAIRQADKIVNGEESTLNVNVKAHKPGSFGVEFEVVQILETAVDIVKILGLTGAAAVINHSSVMAVLRNIKGKKIKGVVKKTGSDSVITLDDGEQIKCNAAIEKIVTDQTFRDNFDSVFYAPIKDDESASVLITDENLNEVDEVIHDEVSSFKKIDGRAVDSKEEEKTTNVRFTQVNFDSGSKGWRMQLPNDETDVAVKIEDSAFLNRIESSEQTLVKGSLFEVKLNIKTHYKINKPPRPTYKIERVIRHRADTNKKLL